MLFPTAKGLKAESRISFFRGKDSVLAYSVDLQKWHRSKRFKYLVAMEEGAFEEEWVGQTQTGVGGRGRVSGDSAGNIDLRVRSITWQWALQTTIYIFPEEIVV